MVEMAESHVRTSYRRNPNFCERCCQSLFGILIGAVLICAATVLIFWNEGRAVQTHKSLEEGLKLVVENQPVPNSFNDNKLVHVTGSLETEKALTDNSYGVSIKAVKLKRHVEMYQWIEEEHRREYNEGSKTRVETTYSYSKHWRTDLVDSSRFDKPGGRLNPKSFLVTALTLQAQDVQVNDFYLSKALISQINEFKPVPSLNIASMKELSGWFYHKDPFNPQIGDMRVKFEYAGLAKFGTADQASILGRQLGGTLTGYQTHAGDAIEVLMMGTYTAKQMFDKQIANNVFMTWALRGAGWLLTFIGFCFLTKIVSTLVDWFPIVREIVNVGVFIVNVSLSISWSLTIIAIGWMAYRPWLSLSLLACAALPFIMARFRSQPKRRD